ncbi:MAG: DivIVA domain-containing protein [Actinomycetota bacterium]|nr:DivIVA domain-containing protein [Actinomycetota bacterium]
MAVSSFPRPDPSSPNSVAQASFGSVRKGFDPSEVREFLGQVAAEMNRLRERERQLEQSLLESKDAQFGSERIDDSTATRLLGEEAAHILQAARESAGMVKSKAEQGASSILREATEEAARVREEADIEAARRRNDAVTQAEQQRSSATQQGREMVNEARAYRERVMGELTRRRDLVRTQIDDLIRGRESLLTAFNAARDAADDVLSRIGPLGDAGTPYELPAPPPIPDADLDAGVPAFGGGDERATHEAEPAPEPEPTAAFFDQDDENEGVDGLDQQAAADPLLAPPTFGEPAVEETGVGRSGSVVELFPAGAPTDETADSEIDEEEDDDTGEDPNDDAPGDGNRSRSNVDNLFARLRAADTDTDGDTDATESSESTRATHQLPVVDSEFDSAGSTAATSPGGAEEEGDEQSPFDRRDAQLTPLIVSAARRVKRVLADEQNEALDALRKGEPVREVGELLGAEVERASRYVDAIANEMEAAATAGAMSVADDPNPDVAHSGALGPVREAFAASIVAPLRERLERAVADGDGDNDGVAKKVRAVYREWKTRQIDDQLDDVFRLAYGRGALVALPPGKPVRWIVDPNGPACPDAEDNSLAGSVAAGDAFPTGHVCAPAHAGCRCLLEPDRQ